MPVSPETRDKESHPQTPSQHYAAYHQAIEDHVTEAAGIRAQRDREEQDKTNYHRNAELDKGAS